MFGSFGWKTKKVNFIFFPAVLFESNVDDVDVVARLMRLVSSFAVEQQTQEQDGSEQKTTHRLCYIDDGIVWCGASHEKSATASTKTDDENSTKNEEEKKKDDKRIEYATVRSLMSVVGCFFIWYASIALHGATDPVAGLPKPKNG